MGRRCSSGGLRGPVWSFVVPLTVMTVNTNCCVTGVCSFVILCCALFCLQADVFADIEPLALSVVGEQQISV